jgi:hypothetical protein
MVNHQSVSVETLKAIADAFNAHDLDAKAQGMEPGGSISK